MLQTAIEMSWGRLISIRLSRLGIVSSRRIEDFVRSVIGDISFEDLKVPCHVVVTDLEDGKKRVVDTGPIAKVVRASCSIPQIFLPVEVDGRYYVDGGFCEYLPVETLQEIDDMFVIAVSLAQNKSIYRRPSNYIQLAIHIMGLIAKTNYVVSEKKADFVIHPDLDQYSAFDFDNAEEMIELGYETTKALIPEITRQWKQKSSRLHKLIHKISRKQDG